MESYVDTSRVSIRPIYKPLARDIIEKNHYSGRLSSCRYPLGVFYQTDNQHQFFDEAEEKLIGVACYGFPVGRRVIGSIFKEEILENKNILELTRLFIHDGYGSNIESYLIGEGFKWLRKNRKDIKALISYSDPQQGHVGTIYQATNWLYQGNRIRPNDSWLFKWEEEGKWQHGRTIFPYYGTNDIEKMKSLVEKDFWVKKELRKHRYVYLLGSKSEKRKALKNLKYPILPYPKVADIEKVEIRRIKCT